MNCELCRARMCTDGLLNNLRCAECRQIKSDQFRDVAAKASLIVLGGFLAWYIFRLAEREDLAVQEASFHSAELTPELIAGRRRA